LITWISRRTRNFQETIVQTEIVPNGILPGRKSFFVVGKAFDNEIANATERQTTRWRLENGHGNQGNIGIRWLDVVLFVDILLLIIIDIRV
jgi:hypothetical protein